MKNKPSSPGLLIIIQFIPATAQNPSLYALPRCRCRLSDALPLFLGQSQHNIITCCLIPFLCSRRHCKA